MAFVKKKQSPDRRGASVKLASGSLLDGDLDAVTRSTITTGGNGEPLCEMKVLVRNLSLQFGSKGPEKLTRLMFLLKEQQDVYSVLTQKLVEFLIATQSTKSTFPLLETLVHYVFDPSDMQPLRNHRLNYLVYSVATQTLQQLDKIANAKEGGSSEH